MSVAKILNYTYEDYKSWEGEWELIDGIPVSKKHPKKHPCREWH